MGGKKDLFTKSKSELIDEIVSLREASLSGYIPNLKLDPVLKSKNNTEKLNELEGFTQVGSFEVDLSNNKVYCSDQLQNILEIGKKNSVKDVSELLSFIDHSQREKIKSEIENRRTQDGVVGKSLRIVTPDGTVKHLYVWGKFLTNLNNDSRKYTLIGAVQDITWIKKTEVQIKEIENRFKILGENVPGIIYLCRNDSRYTMLYLNDRVEKITGYSKKEFLSGKLSFVELFHPDDVDYVYREVDKAVQNQDAFYLKYRIRNKKGQWRWVEETGVGVFKDDKLKYLEGYIIDVTEKYLNEIKLKESEDRLRLALKSSSIGIFDFDLRNETVRIDTRIKRTLGIRKKGRSFPLDELLNFVHKDDLTSAFEKIEEIRQDPKLKNYQMQIRVVRGNSKILVLQLYGTIIRTSKIGPERVIGTIQNITEQKNYEQLLDSINQTVSDGIYKSIQNQNFVYANKAFLKIFGFNSTKELQGIQPGDLYANNEEKRKVRSLFKKSNHVSNIEVLLKRKDGSQFWGLMSSTLKKEDDGNLYFNGTIRDITELKQAELKLVEQKEKNEKILETTINGYLFMDLNGKIMDSNPAICKILGYTKSELSGKTIMDMASPAKKEHLVQNHKVLIEKGSLQFETQLLNKKKKVLDLEVSSSIVRYNSKKYIVSFLQDITSRKQAEKRAEAHQNDLEDALRSLSERNFELDQLMYKVSHDLRSPLSSILGLINIFKIEKEEENKTKYLELIEDRVNKLDGFVRSMINYAKTNRSELMFEKINFKSIITECLSNLQYLDNYKSLNVIYNVNGGAFISDPVRLQLIFANIISNAFKYQGERSDKNYLKINISTNKKRVKIEFIDNGIGISEEYKGKIFDMFVRATEKSDGSGLGMYIVKQSVDKLDGNISLYSSLGKGTRIEIELPNYNYKEDLLESE